MPAVLPTQGCYSLISCPPHTTVKLTFLKSSREALPSEAFTFIPGRPTRRSSIHSYCPCEKEQGLRDTAEGLHHNLRPVAAAALLGQGVTLRIASGLRSGHWGLVEPCRELTAWDPRLCGGRRKSRPFVLSKGETGREKNPQRSPLPEKKGSPHARDGTEATSLPPCG